jgi:hypothetical protein
VGPGEDPDFAKQNDRDSPARPLTEISTKLWKLGFKVPPRQGAADGTGDDQFKGCAGASASFVDATALRHQMWSLVNGLLDVDKIELKGEK